MSNRQITIAVDAMGGENSPFKCLKGIEIFSSNKPNVSFKIYGDQVLISECIKYNNLQIIRFYFSFDIFKIQIWKNESQYDHSKYREERRG